MTLIICLLVGALAVQQFQHSQNTRSLMAATSRERKSLLDRIQHPERIQVEPTPLVEHEVPQDLTELAMVGREVPEFIQVGENGAHGG